MADYNYINVDKLLQIAASEKDSTFKSNGKEKSYDELFEALAGKGKHKLDVDIDGDGFYDVQLSKFKKGKNGEKGIHFEQKELKSNSARTEIIARQILEIDEMLDKGGISETSAKNIKQRKAMLLKELKSAKIDRNSTAYKKLAAKIKAEKTAKNDENLHLDGAKEIQVAKKVEPVQKEALAEKVEIEKDETFTNYVVQVGETPKKIAKKANMAVDKLIDDNKDSIKTFTAKSGKKVQGFLAGAEIKVSGEIDTTNMKSADEVKAEYAATVSKKKVQADKTDADKKAKPEAKAEAKAETQTKAKAKSTTNTDKAVAPKDAKEVKEAENTKATEAVKELTPEEAKANKKAILLDAKHRAKNILDASIRPGTDEDLFMQNAFKDFKYLKTLSKEEYEALNYQIKMQSKSDNIQNLKDLIKSEFNIDYKKDRNNQYARIIYFDMERKGL